MRCHVCKYPAVLLEMRSVKAKDGAMETVSVPSQGPSTHPRIKRWCGGSCMAIMSILWGALSDMGEDAKKTKEGSAFWKSQKKRIDWLSRELQADLRIMSHSRYKYPKEN